MPAPERTDVASRAGRRPTASRRLLAGALSLAAAGLVALHARATITLPIERLLLFVPDDAFYYVGIARHLAENGRPTLDGVHVTNGFHPGWMVLLTGVSCFGLDAPTMVRAALALGYALHAATAVALVALLRKAGPVLRAPAVAGVLWLLNPFPLLLVQQCVESSLFLLAAVLFLDSHVRMLEGHERGRGPARRHGATAALLIWSRTDAALLVVLSGLQLAHHPSGRTGEGRRSIARAAVVTTVLVLPWLIYSLFTVGTLVQDSAAMKGLWRAADARIGPDPVGWPVLTGAWFGIPAMWMSGSVYVPSGLTIARFVILVGAGAAFFLLRDAKWRALLILLLGWTLAAGAAYAWAITDLQVWHFAPSALVLFLVTWLGWSRASAVLTPRWRLLPPVAAGAAILLTACLSVASWRHQPVLYPWQPDIREATLAFERHLPAGAVVGSFGAGIAGTLGQRSVVNLDGLVNHEAVTYWKARRWDAFLETAGITHIEDDQANFDRAMRFSERRVRVSPLATFPLTGWHSGPRTLWRIEEDAPARTAPAAHDPR